MAAERVPYAEEIEVKLNEARARVKELEAVIDREPGGSTVPYREKVTELRSHLQEMEKRVQAMQYAREDARSGFRKGLEDTWKTLKNALSIADYMEERRSHLRNLEEKLEEGRARINELRTRAENAEGEAKLQSQKEIERLLPKLKLAEDKVKVLKDSREEAWESLKEGAETAWNDLKSGLTEAMSKFK
jgi:chromosome segregation ATPase